MFAAAGRAAGFSFGVMGPCDLAPLMLDVSLFSSEDILLHSGIRVAGARGLLAGAGLKVVEGIG